jgi:hypothetical protein
MTRNLIAKATRTLWSNGSSPAGRRRRGTSPCLENLEGRLSLSGIVGNHIGMGVSPAIQGNHIGVTMAIQGNHIGVAMAIQGNHIGVAMAIQGNHIGMGVTPDIVGNHIGTSVAVVAKSQ